MRILLQILSLLFIIWMGWTQPFRDAAASIFPWAGIPPSRLADLKKKAAEAEARAQAEAAAATPRPKIHTSTMLEQPSHR